MEFQTRQDVNMYLKIPPHLKYYNLKTGSPNQKFDAGSLGLLGNETCQIFSRHLGYLPPHINLISRLLIPNKRQK